jgi:uncharacterized protein
VGVIQECDAWMRCRDGTRLVSRVWRPEGQGPWPVLLMRQPYGRAIASTPTYAHPSWYAQHGFLLVVQDVRGQGDSEGEFGGFAQEARDSADTVRWARALPDSNGRLGTYGFSYQGFTQLVSDASAADGRPDCLAVAMAGLDERCHWASSGGAHWWALGLGWGLQLAALQCRRRGDSQGWREIRHSLSSGSFLDDGAELLARHDPGGMAWRWLQRDPALAEDWPSHTAPELGQRPLLLIGGWHDPHLEGVLALWQQARHQGGEPLLRIGAWTHLNWQEGTDQLHLAFFRRHLQDVPTTAELTPAELTPDIAVQNERTGRWQAGSTPCRGPHTWWLQSDGLACCGGGALWPAEQPPQASSQPLQWLVHDPWRPVPGRGGHLDPQAGSCERGDLDQRRDVACFTSGPLEYDLEMVVRPRLVLRVAADQPGFDLCVALSRLEPSGSVRQLSVGIERHRGAGCLVSQWRQVRLQPLLLQLHPGERLRLSLAAAAWPQVAVNPGTGALPWGASGPDHRVITLRFDLAEARLELEPLLNSAANCGK